MKNTTIFMSSNFGKGLRSWRVGLLVLYALLSATVGSAQTGTIAIGSGTTTGGIFPINSCWGYNYSQQIVSASEFASGGGVPGQLTKIRFYYTGGGTNTAMWNTWTVYLGHTSKTSFTSNTDWEAGANLTQVFSGTVTPVANNWMELTLSTPFTYNGTSNLIVAVDENVPSWSCTANWGSYTSTANTGIYYYNDSTNPDPAAPPSGTRTGTIARLQFEGPVASCLSPTALASVNTGLTTTTVSWTASASTPANGYAYYVANTNTPPTAGSTPTGTVGAGVTSVNLTSLDPMLTYYVWVKSVCSGTDSSSWAGPKVFYPGYCIPAPSSQDGTGITNVVLGTIANPTGSETGFYGNYATMATSAALGSTVSFAITYSTGFTYGTKIWVDWNDDADFDDAGELVYTGLSAQPNPSTLSGTFMVPVTAPVGSHRVRIGGTDNDTGGTPCYTGSWGTYEDYTITTFLPPAPVVASFTPASYCAASGEITITGTDLGNATLTIGGTPVTPLTTNTTTQIVATVPAGVSGTVNVTTVGGSATTATTFVVNAPAVFTLSDDAETICSGNSTALVTITAGASSFDTYVWSPSTGVSGTAATGFTFNPTETTTYTLTATQSAGPCMVMVDYTVTVNPLPEPVTVNPSEYEACLNEVVTLTASGGESIIPVAYCSPTVGSVGASGDYLNNFSFANITNNASGDTASDYTYYNALTANVTGGSAYTVSLQSGNPTWLQYFRIWIDYNHDGTFSDSESVYNSTTAVNSSTIVTGSVTIPATAINGVTRMRVLCSYNTLSLVSSDCSWTGFGEFEDYNVNITGATNAVDYVWAPVAGLFTDAAATIPYTAGTSAMVVYAKPTADVTYSATASTDLGCPTSGESVITVTVTPAPTSAVTEVLYTVITTVSQLNVTGTAVQWYTTATGGTPLAGTTELVTGTYYASQTLNGCESQVRLAINVSVILPEMDWVNLQWPDVVTTPQGTAITAYAQGYEPGVTPGAGPGIGVQAWIGVSASNTNPNTWTTWVPMTFNTQVGNNDEFMAQIGGALAPGTYYYASRFKLLDGPYKYGGYNAAGGSFWDGTTYVSGVLTVECATAAPAAMAMQSFCNSGTVANLMATGTAVQWYAAATGGTALAGTTALVDGTTYYASQTVGCESLTRTAVMAHVNVTPAPTGTAAQTIDTAGWVSDLMATGTAVQWYAAATGGTALAGTTALVDGTTYYASQTVEGCESATRLAVTVTITAAQLDFVNLQWPGEATVTEGNAVTVYGQAYEEGVTPGAGPGAGISAWIAVGSENTDPSTWTTWVPMAFSSQAGNNDEYMAAIGADLAPGTYYYNTRFQINGGAFTYGGYSAAGGGEWNGTTNVNGVLTVLCFTTAPYAAATQVFCNSATVASLTAVGDNIQWYDVATGGIALSPDTVVEDGAVYYASQSDNGCESGRSQTTAYVFVVPAATGEATQEVSVYPGEVATIENIMVVTQGYVIWYASEADAMAGVNPLPAGFAITAGATYYAVAAVDECTSNEVFAVTVSSITLGTDHLDVAAFSYYPNPVKDVLNISYSSDITSVTVFNLLGQQVLGLQPSATNVKVDMNALADGTYVLNVTAGSTVKTIKVVKKQ
ncbi:T9SS type A sorting domain-containing protein [Flavobacterium zepuense]|uniref:T9SS type A sorting domain-containing protein n=1 Tax=Flavobacterium zepuense TaxID=2593302 RepID=A0A552UXZ6_9FLAO|nr:GEVED domain-containing protein [Flavobacterium zepuense]TRW23096.1 T9SS type A sorting domain-containing protein [Flavobacterium zepuense]